MHRKTVFLDAMVSVASKGSVINSSRKNTHTKKKKNIGAHGSPKNKKKKKKTHNMIIKKTTLLIHPEVRSSASWNYASSSSVVSCDDENCRYSLFVVPQ